MADNSLSFASNVGTLTTFQFLEHSVRVIQLAGNTAPWFVAADVCEVLGIANPSMAVRRLDDDEKMLMPSMATSIFGANKNSQTHNIISESGLYYLTITSRKPEAKRFRRWITSEVLPAIRKTGFYVKNEVLANERAKLISVARLVVELAHKLDQPNIEAEAAVLLSALDQREG